MKQIIFLHQDEIIIDFVHVHLFTICFVTNFTVTLVILAAATTFRI